MYGEIEDFTDLERFLKIFLGHLSEKNYSDILRTKKGGNRTFLKKQETKYYTHKIIKEKRDFFPH